MENIRERYTADAERFAQSLWVRGGIKGVGNIGDAIRHSYVSGRLASDIGEKSAEVLGIVNEIQRDVFRLYIPGLGLIVSKDRNLGSREFWMDIYNNAVGRSVARESREEFEFYLWAAIVSGTIVVYETKASSQADQRGRANAEPRIEGTRPTTGSDIGARWDAVEDRYRPDNDGGPGLGELTGNETAVA